MKNHVTIDVSEREKVVLGMFQVAFLLVIKGKKTATIAEIKGGMHAVLKESVDSAPVYLTVKRLLERSKPLIEAVGDVTEGSQRRFKLTPAGSEAAKAGLDTMSKVVKAFS